MYIALTFVVDPGVHGGTEVQENSKGAWEEAFGGWELRWMSFAITMGGVGFMSIVLGLIVEAINSKMQNLKKGLGDVAETGHTVVLGWTSFTAQYIIQICLANESDNGGVIVVLDDKDKIGMETVRALSCGFACLGACHPCVRSSTPASAHG
jgi:hypothetical protein